MNSKRFPWLSRNLLGFGIASMCSDCSHEMVPLILPTFLSSLVDPLYTPLYVGIISSVSTFTMSIMALASGRLTDRGYNRKKLIELGYFLEALFVGILSFATNWVHVLFNTTLAWAGRGVIGSARSASIAQTTDPRYYGRAFGFRQAMDTIGSVIGPLIVYTLASWPLRSLFFVALIPAILALLAIIILTTDNEQSEKKTAKKEGPTLLPQSFKLLITALFLFALGNFSKTLLVLRAQTLLSPLYGPAQAFSITTLLYSFRNVVQAFATYSTGALSDQIGRKRLLAITGFFCFGIVSLLLLYKTADLWFIALIFFLSGISAGTTTSLEKSLAADMLPETSRGRGYGILTTAQSIGTLLSSAVVGYLWTAFSVEAAFIYAAVLSSSAAVLFFLFGGPEKQNKS